MLVIDASMALAWAFERQQPEDGQRASRLLSDCGRESWWVPALWHLEVANALLVAERRGLIASSASDLFRARLQALPIETDATPLQETEPRILAIARAHGLSSYDASYLELAQRLGASLASFDRRLNTAAQRLDVALQGANGANP
jgi:predicted nucleic acid-binding protein